MLQFSFKITAILRPKSSPQPDRGSHKLGRFERTENVAIRPHLHAQLERLESGSSIKKTSDDGQ